MVMALLRQTVKSLSSTCRVIINRNIAMSSRLRSEEALDELKKKNPYFEKYASKIAALQQTSPEEFLQRVESVEKNQQELKEEKPR